MAYDQGNTAGEKHSQRCASIAPTSDRAELVSPLIQLKSSAIAARS
jgi:hypothetical protein